MVLVFKSSRKNEVDTAARAGQSGYVRQVGKNTPNIIFLEEGVRLRPNNPIWSQRRLRLVVAIDCWQGKPPADGWSCETRQIRHQDVGGVSNGCFDVFLAKSVGLKKSISRVLTQAVRARFKHMLDPTLTGIRCAIPSDKLAPLGQDVLGLLHWDRRFYNIESPTVFLKAHWVRRRLSLKELSNVLDLPKESLESQLTKEFFLKIKVPGKVRAQVIESIRES